MTVQTLNKRSREPRTKSVSIADEVPTKVDTDDAVTHRVLGYFLRESFIYPQNSNGRGAHLRCFDLDGDTVLHALATSEYVRTSHPRLATEERSQITERALRSLVKHGLVRKYRGPALSDGDSNYGYRLSESTLERLLATGAWADRPATDASDCIRRAWARHAADALL